MADMVRVACKDELFEERYRAFECDGCLDAPETLPAGAFNSVDWADWKRRPIAGPSELARG
jgi:hypothetical protein